VLCGECAVLSVFGFPKDENTRRELTFSFRPIVRGTGAVGVVYFLINALKRIIFSSGTDTVTLVSLSLILSGVAALIWWLGKRTKTPVQLEICGLVISGAFLLNANVHLLFSYEQENLAYFILMMAVFAGVNPSMRAVIASVLACFASLMYFVYTNQPEILNDYISVSIAGFAAAVGISMLVRGAVVSAVRAGLEAVSERERAVSLSVRDALTGLPNRRSFFLEMDKRIDALRQKSKGFVLTLIDLDGFKPINDTYGHAAGDQLLVEVGQRLKDAAPAGSIVARLGGDEFAVLSDLPMNNDTALDMGTRLASVLASPYTVEGGHAEISGSTGMLVCEDESMIQTEMMERADHALYVSKRDRRGETIVFCKRHEKEFLSVRKIDRALRNADLESELMLLYQPQYDLLNKRVYGFEALARWHSPELGLVTPDLFIPIAERSCHMRAITQILLTKALKALSEMPEDIRMSFNLSAHDLMSPAAIDNILHLIETSGVRPDRLEFEITETAMMVDFDTACRSVESLCGVGCSLSIDDFGVGYSNFSYLQRLSVSKIKIDRSFIASLLDDPTASKIIRTLINLSNSLDMECVLEGVETSDQLDVLKSFGAQFIQGYLIARPMPDQKMQTYLDAVESGELDRLNLGVEIQSQQIG